MLPKLWLGLHFLFIWRVYFCQVFVVERLCTAEFARFFPYSGVISSSPVFVVCIVFLLVQFMLCVFVLIAFSGAHFFALAANHLSSLVGHTASLPFGQIDHTCC